MFIYSFNQLFIYSFVPVINYVINQMIPELIMQSRSRVGVK